MTERKEIRPFGTWPSPLSAADVATAGVRYGLCRIDGGDLCWSELRPDEGPRAVIVRLGREGGKTDVNPAPFSARSRVHEYGGGEFAVRDGLVVFVNDRDQDLHAVRRGSVSRLTEAPDWRFADMDIAPDGSHLVAVGERHEPEGGHVPPQNVVVTVRADAKPVFDPDILLAGRDFYAAPRLSPDGGRLAWLAWDLPHMPWEAAELWVADIGGDGGIANPRHVAGGAVGGAFQPAWLADGRLLFVADHEGWGNLHMLDGDGTRVVHARAAEFGRPLWNFGMTSHAVLDDDTVAATCWSGGRLEAGLVDLATGAWTALDTGLSRLDNIAGAGDRIALLGGDDVTTPGVHLFDRSGRCLGRPAGGAAVLPEGSVSKPELVRIGAGDEALFALHYPPANAGFTGPKKAAPPMVVFAHGGPTAMAKRGLDLEKQYWTTRGFACLDVDYRGSFGYGRAYVRALDGAWGELDSADIAAAVRHAVDARLADGGRIVITGSSAGGLTVLNALAGSDIFAAGASTYGVADLASLAAETHKFEAGYIYSLMGVDPDDAQAIQADFAARSPLEHPDRIDAPMIFLQGLDDAVVPPNQSEAMAASLRSRGVPVALIEYAGEGHGFRKPETVISALQSVHAFFARILGLEPADDLPAIAIDNLD